MNKKEIYHHTRLVFCPAWVLRMSGPGGFPPSAFPLWENDFLVFSSLGFCSLEAAAAMISNDFLASPPLINL